MTATFLSPIEAPQGLVKKLAYYFTRKQFGRVPTPIKVHSARLPTAFGLFYAKIGKLDRRLTLPRELVFLIREQVARINVCEFCMDIGRWFSIKESMNQAKFDALDSSRERFCGCTHRCAEAEHITLAPSNWGFERWRRKLRKCAASDA